MFLQARFARVITSSSMMARARMSNLLRLVRACHHEHACALAAGAAAIAWQHQVVLERVLSSSMVPVAACWLV